MLSMFRGPLTAGLIAISMLCCTTDALGAAKIVRGKAAANGTATVTQHAYAIDPADMAANPTWQLRDATNTLLYVNGRPAADFGNAAYRTWWIQRAQAALAGTGKGLFIDDVFMERRTYTLGGTSRTAIDPRTGAAITEANWQKYMADFMVAVRAALPGVQIVHDVLWLKGDSGDVLRELQAANSLSVDGGFTTNVMTSGFATLASWTERAQARGTGVIFDYSTSVAATRLYGLASFLLVDNGTSAIANDASTVPGAVWSGYGVELGAPVGARYSAGTGAWRRDFTRGIVIVNEPYRSNRAVTIPAGYQDLDGVPRTSVTLAGGQGVVLVPTPAPRVPVSTPTPVPPAPPVTTPEPSEPAPGAPVAITTPTPTPPTKITTVTTGGNGAAKARTSGTAGAREPGSTSVSVRGSSRRLSGRVSGAVAGYVRLTVERKRGGKWVVMMRTKGSVKKSGSFSRDIPRLRKGAYRVSGYFEGTGTSEPSRSSAKPFRA